MEPTDLRVGGRGIHRAFVVVTRAAAGDGLRDIPERDRRSSPLALNHSITAKEGDIK